MKKQREEKRERERDERERIVLLFSRIFFLIGKNGLVWSWYRCSPAQESYCRNSNQKKLGLERLFEVFFGVCSPILALKSLLEILPKEGVVLYP